MPLSIAHLGPAGTYAEQAAAAYAHWLSHRFGCESPVLCPESSITQCLFAVAERAVSLAVVPVENSIEGGVTFTLDTLWQVPDLLIHQAFVIPIQHCLVTRATQLAAIATVLSHPQALGQCRLWLAQHLPQAELRPTNSTTEALGAVDQNPTLAAIASQRAATLYHLPWLRDNIQDHPDNCTRFWVIRHQQTQDIPMRNEPDQHYASLAFSVPQNIPGALVKTLAIFADRSINLSRIESRPAKTLLGDYVFFLDAEVDEQSERFQLALAALAPLTETLKVLGGYSIVNLV
jgi:prephenate dehydratase